MTPVLTKSLRAPAAIAGNVIVAASSGQAATTASSATSPSIGVSDSMGAGAGGIVDIVQVGWGEVRAGGNIVFGDPLTADAQGRAVKAVAAAGTVVRIVGFAMSDAALGDIIPINVVPSVIASA